MNKKIDILSGKIGINLLRLSLPIMIGSIVIILYGLTDIKFISLFVGDRAVTSATAAMFYSAFAFAFILIPKTSSQILVAQEIGAKKYRNARKYARISIIIAVILSIIAVCLCFAFSEQLIRFVGVKNEELLKGAILFLRYNSLGFPFLFLAITLSAIISSDGDTVGPFVFVVLGVGLNVVLDYVYLGVLKYGVEGAAIATSLSQCITTILLIFYYKSPKSKFRTMKLIKLDEFKAYMKVLRLGFPAGFSQALLTFISIVVANSIAQFDENILAVQRLGVQFEAFSWGIIAGLGNAVATYVAQNFGAKKYDRIEEVFKISLNISIIFGILISVIFIVYPEKLFSYFFADPYLIKQGKIYMIIIGLTQIFQCIEIIAQGALSGLGKINEQTIVSSVGTLIRIPLIYIFAPLYGLNAIWCVISFTMFIKGIIIYIWYKIIWKNFLKGSKEYENINRE